jgi:hypothetical protein
MRTVSIDWLEPQSADSIAYALGRRAEERAAILRQQDDEGRRIFMALFLREDARDAELLWRPRHEAAS